MELDSVPSKPEEEPSTPISGDSEEAFIDRCATFTRGRLTCPYYQTALISEQSLLIQTPLAQYDQAQYTVLDIRSDFEQTLA